jgi:protein TonB
LNDQFKAFNISLGLHLLIILTIISVSSLIVPHRQIVRIDLTVEDTVREEVPPPAPQPVAVKAPSQPVKQQIQQPTPAVHEVQADKQAPLPEPVVQRQEPVREVLSSVKAEPARPAPPREPSQPGYSREQFFYIRDLVQKKAMYPKIAQQRSWEGQVVISFVVLSDGSAKEIKVVTSSGRDILDRSAVEAVKSASPFPRPPAELELKMPITYKLLEGG